MSPQPPAPSLRPLTILSGGQTGVDRGALDAALAAGAPCGGWCPQGRLAEDGAIPGRYPLIELPGADYAARTKANVRDSDGTLVITTGGLEGGTKLTAEHAKALGRPLYVADAAEGTATAEVDRICAWIARHGIRRLNVAGPRASRSRNAYEQARLLIAGVLERVRGS